VLGFQVAEAPNKDDARTYEERYCAFVDILGALVALIASQPHSASVAYPGGAPALAALINNENPVRHRRHFDVPGRDA
jgi:hypothetical protein